MEQRDLIVVKPAAGVQHVSFALKIGERSGLAAQVSVTSVGLLSIGALISSILLSSAVIVLAARPRR